MVNASLNWASIVGIVLAVSGAGLYFLRSFKPALARDYDVFFAAIGLLCGGILFFQGWRLDPILQFGQFLLAGTTVFFAYESVRLRGVATDQARRSSYFDEDYDPPISKRGYRGSDDEDFDQFEEPQPIRRRFSSTDNPSYENPEEEFYSSRKPSRAAIPERAASRRGRFEQDSMNQNSVEARRRARFQNPQKDSNNQQNFGSRRVSRNDQRRGTRPIANRDISSVRGNQGINTSRGGSEGSPSSRPSRRYQEPTGAPMQGSEAEDASFSSPLRNRGPKGRGSQASRTPPSPNSQKSEFDQQQNRRSSNIQRPRDNNSRFDD